MTAAARSFGSALLRALPVAMRRFNVKGDWVMSSHVAMSMMLALFPFAIFVVSVAGFLSRELSLAAILTDNVHAEDVTGLIFGAWPDAIEGPIVAELTRVLAADNVRLMTVGGLLMLFFASNGVDAVRQAMTRAYHDVDHRPFWKARLLCIVFVVVGAAAVMFAVLVELALPFYTARIGAALPWEMPKWLSDLELARPVISAMPVLAALAAHVFLPGRRHRLRRILPGVLLSTALWMLVGWGFSYYVRTFGSYSATYAGLAGAMAALIFLYLISAILIFGAEYNGALIDMGDDGA
jgi:membrane protein